MRRRSTTAKRATSCCAVIGTFHHDGAIIKVGCRRAWHRRFISSLIPCPVFVLSADCDSYSRSHYSHTELQTCNSTSHCRHLHAHGFHCIQKGAPHDPLPCNLMLPPRRQRRHRVSLPIGGASVQSANFSVETTYSTCAKSLHIARDWHLLHA